MVRERCRPSSSLVYVADEQIARMYPTFDYALLWAACGTEFFYVPTGIVQWLNVLSRLLHIDHRESCDTLV